ncbi:armadillo-type protein [Stachybotrys elegans]|uniref:Nucleolar protein 9 n=1 Tax=Stachybotrys elegans TaxID=80388 RepID=A0A8K0SWE7_9HYPO|nr:armadillo-type protein [Stachybotrys elegans]
MPKPRTKRGELREQRKRKRQDENNDVNEADTETKRPRHHDDNEGGGGGGGGHQGVGEKEFFGMLADEEQEYFRRADEMLELNQFPSPEDRNLFIESVFTEANGKELKLASSQSCSRLMERLIQLSSTAQKKALFEAFAGHFLTLVQHRFASHCCEALFLRSANVVTQELAGFVLDTKGAKAEEQQPEVSMENLFLATLDELEGNLAYLITDRFASHTLRALLLVLSGRPLDDPSLRTLVKSKKKENISVAGANADESTQGLRAVPLSFTMAVQKIVEDSTSGMDATELRVLATHPIGNPTLQLLLELDLTMNKGGKKADATQPKLLFQLLPDAPQSLSDEQSEASQFINGMVYDPIGARLIETIITHSPGKIFKALNQNIFLPRISGYVRNDVSSYASIRVLNRLGKDDLVSAVEQIAPSIPQLVAKSRFNVLRTLFERCSARGIQDQIKVVMKGLREGCGSNPVDLITTLCGWKDEEKKKKNIEHASRNEYAIQSHGAQLLTSLLLIPGPCKGVQESLLALSPETLLRLATTSMPTVTILTTALAQPSTNPAFHKSIVSTLLPHTADLGVSQFGHNLLNALVEVPSKGKERSVPFHMKEAVMTKLGEREAQLRDCWMGRSVWRTWKGDMWRTRRADWKAWMREVDAFVEEQKKQANGKAAKHGDGKAEKEEQASEAKVAEDKEKEEVAAVEEKKDTKEKKKKKKKSSHKASQKTGTEEAENE